MAGRSQLRNESLECVGTLGVAFGLLRMEAR
jgi:hypothetical protein